MEYYGLKGNQVSYMIFPVVLVVTNTTKKSKDYKSKNPETWASMVGINIYNLKNRILSTKKFIPRAYPRHAIGSRVHDKERLVTVESDCLRRYDVNKYTKLANGNVLKVLSIHSTGR